MLTRRLLTSAAVAALLLVTGCTGGDDPDETVSPEDRLAHAAEAIEQAPSLEISLRTDRLPTGTRGLLSADGVGDHSPAFDGEVQVVAGGATIGAEIVSVDGKVWAKTGLSPVWAPLDPADFGAPDPADLVGVDADSGLAGLLGHTDDLRGGEKSRDRELVLTEVTGTIPGERIAALIPTADDAGEFRVTYRLTDEDTLHDATLTGPFYAGADEVTYTLSLTPRDEPATIGAP